MPATIRDYAHIARSVYEPTKQAAVTYAANNGWEYSDFRGGMFTSGFQGAVYFKVGSAPREYVVAFKGSKTSKTAVSDWLVNDVLIGLRQVPTQFHQAHKLMEQTIKRVGAGASITLVGHSLGGALVQCVAAHMLAATQVSYRFVNFNGPGMKKNVERPLKHLPVQGLNYICSADFIGNQPDDTGRSHFGRFYSAQTTLSKPKAHGMGGVFTSFDENRNNSLIALATLDQLGI
jgi:pimeloyl-ACP methyl ester carboxylesterase